MPTSLISKIKRDSFITFQSSNEDIEVFNRSVKNFRFSHFALLKLPDIKQSVNNENVLDFERIQSRYLTGNSTATPPVEGDIIDISESFQNYVLNFESLVRSKETYDRDLPKNVNERIFFKWLKEIGAIRFKQAQTGVSNISGRYTEQNDNDDILFGNYYNRVVKYIGEISIQNKVSSTHNNFEEVVMFVPSQAGVFQNPLFKTVSDGNYSPLSAFIRADQANAEYIDGYDSSSTALNGLSLLAQYDIDVQGLTYVSVNQTNPLDTDPWLGYYSGENAYLTDRTFNDPSDDLITVSGGTAPKTFLRNRLDGISLDLDKSSYTIFNDPSIESFDRASENGESFDFNCVLLYYQIDTDGITETNLYGVLFIDNLIELAGGASKIKSFQKIKTSTLLEQTGTGFGIKLNFRVDNANGSFVPEVVVDVNDYNSFSMQLFSEASARMNELMQRYEETVIQNIQMQKRMDDLVSMLSQNNSDPSSIIDEINQKLIPDQNTSGILDLIKKNSDLLNSILKNQTPIEIEIAVTPNLYGGITGSFENGIMNLRLSDSSYGFYENKPINSEFGNINEFKFSGRKSLLVLSSQTPTILENDINIYLDDSNGWEYLQALRIAVGDNIDISGVNINVFTDKTSKFTNTSYGLLISTLKLEKTNSFEVVCVDKVEYRFTTLR
jgi:hypothetical protein